MSPNVPVFYTFLFIIPHVKILSHDWLTAGCQTFMYTEQRGQRVHWTACPPRDNGFPSGFALGENHPPFGRHSINVYPLGCRICIVCTYHSSHSRKESFYNEMYHGLGQSRRLWNIRLELTFSLCGWPWFHGTNMYNVVFVPWSCRYFVLVPANRWSVGLVDADCWDVQIILQATSYEYRDHLNDSSTNWSVSLPYWPSWHQTFNDIHISIDIVVISLYMDPPWPSGYDAWFPSVRVRRFESPLDP